MVNYTALLALTWEFFALKGPHVDFGSDEGRDLPPVRKRNGYRFEWHHIELEFKAPCKCDTLHGPYCRICRAKKHFDDLAPSEVVRALYMHLEDLGMLIRNDLEKPLRVNPLLYRAAEACLKDARYRRAGIPDAFIWYILNQQQVGGEGNCHWFFPLMGLVNIIIAIYRDKTDTGVDADIMKKIKMSYCDIRDLLFDSTALKKDCLTFDVNAKVASEFILLLLADPEMKRSMYDKKTLSLIMRNWSYSSYLHPAIRGPITQAALVVISNNDPWGNRPPRGHIRMIYDACDLPALVSRIDWVCKQKKLLEGICYRELTVILDLVQVDITASPFIPLYLENEVHHLAAAAVHRQVLKGTQVEQTDACLHSLITSLEYIFVSQCGNEVPILEALLAKTPIVDLFAAALCSVGERPGVTIRMKQEWFLTFLMRIMHVLDCHCPPDDQQSCEYYRLSPERLAQFIGSARTGFSRAAIPTLLFMREAIEKGFELNWGTVTMDRGPTLVQTWVTLMALLQVSPVSIRQQRMTDRTCCFELCPKRVTFQNNKKHSTCVRCRSVYYCGRDCQKKDWPTHRIECKRYQDCQQKGIPVKLFLPDNFNWGPKFG